MLSLFPGKHVNLTLPGILVSLNPTLRREYLSGTHTPPTQVSLLPSRPLLSPGHLCRSSSLQAIPPTSFPTTQVLFPIQGVTLLPPALMFPLLPCTHILGRHSSLWEGVQYSSHSTQGTFPLGGDQCVYTCRHGSHCSHVTTVQVIRGSSLGR